MTLRTVPSRFCAVRRSIGMTLPLLALASCSDIVGVATPDGGAPMSPARVALSASIGTSARQELVTLRITAAYLRANGQQVPIGVQSKTLSSDDVQSVPIPIDVASCLADALRTQQDQAGGVCRVMLALQLQVDAETVDEQVVGPLTLKPGNILDVTEPVSLSVIESIELTDANGAEVDPATPIQVVLGGSFALAAAILDDAGKVVENRNVNWSTSNAAVATVDGEGKVTTLAPGQVTITAAVNAVRASAQFVVLPPPVALTIAAKAGSGSGKVVSNPAGIDCRLANGVASGACSFSFANNAQVTLTSSADNGSAFVSWGDDCTASAIGVSCQLTLGTARTASAVFAAMRTLSVGTGAGDGHGRITGAGLDCVIQSGVPSGVCDISVVDGASVQLQAVAQAAQGGSAANLFTSWGGACTGTSGNCTVVVQGGNVQVTSAFAAPKTLSVQLGGNGSGTVSSSPIECVRGDNTTTGTCSASYVAGASVTLTAAAGPTSSFVGWGGSCAGSTGNTCEVSMTAARSAQATFTRNNVTLTLALSGEGAGAVRVDGIVACSQGYREPPTTCTINTVAGTTLSISASAGSHSSFDGFSGACTEASACQVVMNGNRSITANFSLGMVSYTITNFLGSTARGRIVGSNAAAGVDCTLQPGLPTGQCAFSAPYLGTITLTAIPAANSALTQWGGPCQQATTVVCSFAANASSEISGAFVSAINVRLNLDGNGTGEVFFEVTGIPQQQPCANNGSTPVVCTFALPTVPSGHRGIFTAVSSAGSAFSGFTGACSENGAPPFSLCTFRGVGFARDVYGSFLR